MKPQVSALCPGMLAGYSYLKTHPLVLSPPWVRSDHLLELVSIRYECTQTLRHFLGGASVCIEHEAISLLVHISSAHLLVHARGSCRDRIQVAGNGILRLAKHVQKPWRYGHAVRAGQRQNLVQRLPGPRRAPAGWHHDRVVAELLEVVVHARHLHHARVLARLPGLLAALALDPVEDAPGEGADEVRPGLRGGHRLGKPEHQRDVALDALLLQHLAALDALPSPRQLDEDALLGHAFLLVHLNDATCPHKGLLKVPAQPRIHLGGDEPGHQAHNLTAEVDR
mmetsp:Transcript_27989/g.53273  ORF Transcript_27989/g.53273 Transcript_27989/m.53273 type:complete len:282 (+) Transcript_27989:374-1219(+)